MSQTATFNEDVPIDKSLYKKKLNNIPDTTDQTMEVMKALTVGLDEPPIMHLEINDIEIDFSNVSPLIGSDLQKEIKLVLDENYSYNIKDVIFDTIMKNPRITTSDIIEKLESEETWEILEILDELKEEGYVE